VNIDHNEYYIRYNTDKIVLVEKLELALPLLPLLDKPLVLLTLLDKLMLVLEDPYMLHTP
jgi:hypothetical protein